MKITELDVANKLDETKQALLNSYKEALEKGGESVPCAVFITQHKDHMRVNLIPAEPHMFANKESKRKFRGLIDSFKKDFAKDDVTILYSIFSSEAYSCTIDKKELEANGLSVKSLTFEEVSKLATKKEVLMFCIESPKFQETESYNIIRDEENKFIRLDRDPRSLLEGSSNGGLFNNILYQPEKADY